MVNFVKVMAIWSEDIAITGVVFAWKDDIKYEYQFIFRQLNSTQLVKYQAVHRLLYQNFWCKNLNITVSIKSLVI